MGNRSRCGYRLSFSVSFPEPEADGGFCAYDRQDMYIVALCVELQAIDGRVWVFAGSCHSWIVTFCYRVGYWTYGYESFV